MTPPRRGSAPDRAQFRAILRTALRVDLRAHSNRFGRGRLPAVASLVFFHVILGLYLAFLTLANQSTAFAMLVFTTLTMLAAASNVLAEFQTIVLAPEDRQIVSAQPVSSRTYFLARIAALIVYLSIIGGAIAVPVAVSLGFRVSPVAGLTALVAGVLASVQAGLATALTHAALPRITPAWRLKSVAGYAQLLLSIVVFGSGLVFSSLYRNGTLQRLTIEPGGWWTAWPPSWHAALVTLASGPVSAQPLAAALLGFVATVSLVLIADRVLAARYLSDLELQDLPGPAAPVRGDAGRALPGFGEGEPRAVLLLLRAQFRHDHRFRLAVFAVLPITVLYLFAALSGGQGLADPFLDPAGHVARASMLYFAVLFFPAMLVMNTTRSDAASAAWVFQVTAADPARLVRSMKNLLYMFFTLPYLLLLGMVFTAWFTSVRHVLLHTAMLAVLSHLCMQSVYFLRPALPFSQTAQRGRRASAVLGGTVPAVIGSGALMPLLVFGVYPSPVLPYLVLGALIVCSTLLERGITVRVRGVSGAAR